MSGIVHYHTSFQFLPLGKKIGAKKVAKLGDNGSLPYLPSYSHEDGLPLIVTRIGKLVL